MNEQESREDVALQAIAFHEERVLTKVFKALKFFMKGNSKERGMMEKG
jgi:hypothetical protein